MGIDFINLTADNLNRKHYASPSLIKNINVGFPSRIKT